MEPTSVVHSPAFAHHGVSWSPFYENRIAIAASANYGLIGNGRLQVVSLGGTPALPTGANMDKMSVCRVLLPELVMKVSLLSASRRRMHSSICPGQKSMKTSL